ncbi:CU044_5270 family protein [Planotetraspora silvatica]
MEARAALLTRAAGRTPEPVRPRRRFRMLRAGVGLLAVGALAAVVAAGVTVVQTSGGNREPGRIGSVALAANVLDRASAAAEQRPFTPLQSHQWIYTKMSETTGVNAKGGVDGGPYKTVVEERWERADGKQGAGITNGKVYVGPELVRPQRPFSYAPLPTDPDALLQKLGVRTGGYEMAYDSLVNILAFNVVPPKQEAAIFQAIKKIPNVTLITGRVDAAGRPAIALGLEMDAMHQEVLLDPKTYAFLGDRIITIKDQTFESDGGPPVFVKKGTVEYERLRTAVGIVAKPGQRPS